jgi:hypothetical protein
MGVTNPRNIFGIHSIMFYNRSDRKPYGAPLKVLKSGGIDMPADFEDLTGGSERFITPEFKLTTAEFPDYLFQLFLGASVTLNSAEASGNVSTAVNKKGTSTISATTGIASVVVIPTTGAANLKFAKYVIEVVSATTVNILASTDIDFRRGTDVSYQNDGLQILAAAVTITTGGNTDVPELGLRLVGGSGAIAMVVGDTASFDVRPPNAGSSLIDIGNIGTEFVEFGAVVMAQRRADGSLFEIDCLRCVGGGLPLNLEEKAWSQAELTVKVLKDFTDDSVMKIRAIRY